MPDQFLPVVADAQRPVDTPDHKFDPLFPDRLFVQVDREFAGVIGHVPEAVDRFIAPGMVIPRRHPVDFPLVHHAHFDPEMKMFRRTARQEIAPCADDVRQIVGRVQMIGQSVFLESHLFHFFDDVQDLGARAVARMLGMNVKIRFQFHGISLCRLKNIFYSNIDCLSAISRRNFIKNKKMLRI